MRYLWLSLLFFVSAAAPPESTVQWKDGDIIFQITHSSQCKAIQAATGSQYTHVGIMFQEGYSWFVLEAVQPVRVTPFADWVRHGDNGHYVVKRLKDTKPLTPQAITCMKQKGEGYLGKTYDLTFEWSDDRIYCSELVWKLYNSCTGLEVGPLKMLGEFDLSSPIVAKKLEERYGDKVPLYEKVISPGDMFDSELLVTVFSN